MLPTKNYRNRPLFRRVIQKISGTYFLRHCVVLLLHDLLVYYLMFFAFRSLTSVNIGLMYAVALWLENAGGDYLP